jgi:hypothetical protein
MSPPKFVETGQINAIATSASAGAQNQAAGRATRRGKMDAKQDRSRLIDGLAADHRDGEQQRSPWRDCR